MSTSRGSLRSPGSRALLSVVAVEVLSIPLLLQVIGDDVILLAGSCSQELRHHRELLQDQQQ
eukprot:9673501-Heterocapsa_arctica.AAC.1